MDNSKLSKASMEDAIEELTSAPPTNLELRAALTNAMRCIQQLQQHIADLDDGLLALYERTGIFARGGHGQKPDSTAHDPLSRTRRATIGAQCKIRTLSELA